MQVLLWDFKATFPEPKQEAVDAGIISDDDLTPERIRKMHDEHERELSAALREMDALADARRRGVDPATGQRPTNSAGELRLSRLLEKESCRLDRWWENLLGVYAEAFGENAATAFGHAVRARYAGVEVTGPLATRVEYPAPAEMTPKPSVDIPTVGRARHRQGKRILARLPVPQPLPSAVAEGQFGVGDDGKPVRPSAQEVREITEQHAEKMIDLLDALAGASLSGKQQLLESFHSAAQAYADDFGSPAAGRLVAYVRRQAGLEVSARRGR